jgi:LexA DNA binding domain
MKRLTAELTPRQAQILDCLTPCVQEQCYPPTFQELAHGLNLTEKNTRGGMHIREHEGLFTPAAIDDVWLSLRKPLPTALFDDLPLVGGHGRQAGRGV